jgi:hypothetical protein
MIATNSNTAPGGTRMAYIRASRSQAMCMKNHEQQDQRPSEISLKAKVVDEIRASAQDKQPAPDDQIKLNRVLLSLFVRPFLCHVSPLPKIE